MAFPLCGSNRASLPRRAVVILAIAHALAADAREALAQSRSDAPSVQSISGTVLRADSTHRGVANAVLTIGEAGPLARTDSLGRFVLKDVPTGALRLMVRALGFEHSEVRVDVRTNVTSPLRILLSPIPALAPVEVSTSARRGSVFLKEFEERRRAGFGRFVTADELETQGGRSLSTILARRIPGLRAIAYAPGRTAVASPRGISSLRGAKRGDAVDVVSGAPEACYVQVSVNNVLRYRGDRGEQLYNIDLLDPATIEGIEFYTSSQLPAEFNRNSTGNCGALLIWLKP